MQAHDHLIGQFSRRLWRVRTARTTMRACTLWLFSSGACILILRLTTELPVMRLALAAGLGIIPLTLAAGLYEYRRRPSREALRAECDRFNHCGGLLMAGEAQPLGAWTSRLPPLAAPPLAWRSGRPAAGLAAALGFLTIALCVPDRWTAGAATPPLEIGELIETLEQEIEVLEQERILPATEAREWQAALDRLSQESAGTDPAGAWEALDHLREATGEAAAQAVERVLADTARATLAETLAGALADMNEGSLSPAALTEAMRELASLLAAAELNAPLNPALPPALRDALNAAALSPEQLAQLGELLRQHKDAMATSLARLEASRLIDASRLSECKRAGECNAAGLAAALSANGTNSASVAALIQGYGRGGVTRGRGDAPLTWSGSSSEADAGYKEHTLPPAEVAALRDSLRVGLSAAAPETAPADTPVSAGALADAPADGGTALTMATLPRHRAAVERYFAREPERASP